MRVTAFCRPDLRRWRANFRAKSSPTARPRTKNPNLTKRGCDASVRGGVEPRGQPSRRVKRPHRARSSKADPIHLQRAASRRQLAPSASDANVHLRELVQHLLVMLSFCCRCSSRSGLGLGHITNPEPGGSESAPQPDPASRKEGQPIKGTQPKAMGTKQRRRPWRRALAAALIPALGSPQTPSPSPTAACPEPTTLDCASIRAFPGGDASTVLGRTRRFKRTACRRRRNDRSSSRRTGSPQYDATPPSDCPWAGSRLDRGDAAARDAGRPWRLSAG